MNKVTGALVALFIGIVFVFVVVFMAIIYEDVKIDNEEVQALYVGDDIYLKLSDYVSLLNQIGLRASLTYDEVTKGINVSILPDVTDNKVRIKLREYEQDIHLEPVEHRFFLQTFFGKQEEASKMEVRGLSLCTSDGITYVNLTELAHLCGVSFQVDEKQSVTLKKSSAKEGIDIYQYGKRRISYRSLEAIVIDIGVNYSDSRPFLVTGRLKSDILKLLSENTIFFEEPRELYKNAPGTGSVVITLWDGDEEKASFMLIPQNKVDGIYYLSSYIGNEETQYMNLKTNVAGRIAQLLA